MTTTPTTPNELDAALPADLLAELDNDYTNLLLLVPALARTMADVEAHLAAFNDHDHGLTDDQFNAALHTSTPGQVREWCAWAASLLLRPLSIEVGPIDIDAEQARYLDELETAGAFREGDTTAVALDLLREVDELRSTLRNVGVMTLNASAYPDRIVEVGDGGAVRLTAGAADGRVAELNQEVADLRTALAAVKGVVSAFDGSGR